MNGAMANAITCETQGHLWNSRGRCVMCGIERDDILDQIIYVVDQVTSERANARIVAGTLLDAATEIRRLRALLREPTAG